MPAEIERGEVERRGIPQEIDRGRAAGDGEHAKILSHVGRDLEYAAREREGRQIGDAARLAEGEHATRVDR